MNILCSAISDMVKTTHYWAPQVLEGRFGLGRFNPSTKSVRGTCARRGFELVHRRVGMCVRREKMCVEGERNSLLFESSITIWSLSLNSSHFLSSPSVPNAPSVTRSHERFRKEAAVIQGGARQERQGACGLETFCLVRLLVGVPSGPSVCDSNRKAIITLQLLRPLLLHIQDILKRTLEPQTGARNVYKSMKAPST